MSQRSAKPSKKSSIKHHNRLAIEHIFCYTIIREKFLERVSTTKFGIRLVLPLRSVYIRNGFEGGLVMRMKLVFLLIVYCAGFATAVYMLAPVPQQNGQAAQASLDQPFASSQFIQSLNTGLHKGVAVTKAAAKDAGAYIRQKLNETNQNSQ
jgi:hypothetical protein